MTVPPVLTATMTATVTRTTKTVIILRPQVDDFSNRFMNFRIQLQKILSLLVLAIERQ